MRAKPFVRMLLVLAGFQVAALASVAIAELIPDQLIVEELREAYETGVITESLVMSQRNGGLTDHYGECVLLTVGLGDSPGDNLFERAVLSPNLHQCVAARAKLNAALDGEPLDGTYKIRYWNGLSIVSRPTVAVVGVSGLRTLATVALIISIAALAMFLRSLLGRLATIGFLLPLVTANLFGLVEVFHHPLMLTVGLLGALAVGRTVSVGAGLERLALVAMLAGALYSFFDLMNFVTGVLALTAVVAGLSLPSDATSKRRFGYMLVTATSWCFGYLGTWAAKWGFAAIASSPRAVWADVRAQFVFRINGEHEGISSDFGAGLRANVDAWLDPPLTRLILLVTFLTLIVGARKFKSLDMSTLAIVGSFALLPVLFMLFANNHFQIHFWFEYRSLALGLSALLMACGWTWSSRATQSSLP